MLILVKGRRSFKFTDDSVIVSLPEHGPVLKEFIDWWKASCLNINVSKTRNDSETIPVSFLHWWLMSRQWSVYYSTKYLGAVIDDKPTSEHHIDAGCKKAHQRLYFLASFAILMSVAHTWECFIHASLNLSWPSLSPAGMAFLIKKNKNRLQGIVRVCCKVACTTLNDHS